MLAVLRLIAQGGAFILGILGFESIKNSFAEEKVKVQTVNDMSLQGTVWTSFLFGLVFVVAIVGWVFPLSPKMMKKINKMLK